MIRLFGYAAAAAGLAFLWAVDPATSSLYPICPLHAATGLYCAGCGATRALHALLHGEILRALSLNPLLVLAIPFLAPAAANEGMRVLAGREIFRRRLPDAACLAIAAIVIAYGILRNVPGLEFLGPPR